MTIQDLAQGKRLGCPNCWNVFRDEIMTLIQPFQMSNKHTGKVISKLWKLKAERLEKRMERAAARDDFESATKLRDQLRELKRGHSVNEV